jgi:predicted 3-demethylubiquinone-9 3-methyltransferase (glyoxalase superfamily)
VEKIVPFLWFDDQAEEAANFYVSVFSKRPGAGTSRVRNITYYGETGPRPAGMVMTVDFELEGRGITALNGGPEFSFTEALSLAVNCESQEEVDTCGPRCARAVRRDRAAGSRTATACPGRSRRSG